MPNPIIGTLRLTKNQWNMVLRNILEKRPTKSMTSSIMSARGTGARMSEAFPETIFRGRLRTKHPWGWHDWDMPYEEALVKHLRKPGLFRATPGKVPDVEIISRGVEEAGEVPMTHQRYKYLDVKSRADRIRQPIIEAEREQARLRKLARQEKKDRTLLVKNRLAATGLSKERLDTISGQLGVAKADLTTTELSDVEKYATWADSLWSNIIRGTHTTEGKKWKRHLSSAKGKKSSKITPREFFISVFVKHMVDPEKTARTYPQAVNDLRPVVEQLFSRIRAE